MATYKHIYKWREITEGLYRSFEGLAEKIYLTSRPLAADSKIKSYIVIRLSSGIRDRGDTYQTAKALIHIFVKDKPGGVEDAIKIDSIAQNLCSMMPLIHPRFTAYDPNFIASGEDSGCHYQIYQLSLTINKRDPMPEIDDRDDKENPEDNLTEDFNNDNQ